MARKEQTKKDRQTSHVKPRGDRGQQRRDGYGGKGAAGGWEDDLAVERDLAAAREVQARRQVKVRAEQPQQKQQQQAPAAHQAPSTHAHVFEELFVAQTETPHNLHDFKVAVRAIIKEYFVECDVNECVVQVAQLDPKPHFVPFFVRELISAGFDQEVGKRLTIPAVLERGFAQGLLTRQQAQEGFVRAAENLPDLLLDVPQAKEILEALVEECRQSGLLADEGEARILRLLNTETDTAKYAALKDQLSAAFREFFASHDMDEIQETIMSLDYPTYNPDVVRLGVTMSLDFEPSDREIMSKLLCSTMPASDHPFFSSEHIAMGFTKILQNFDDLYRDCHAADRHIPSFIARAISDEAIPPAFLDDRDGLDERDYGTVILDTVSAMINQPRAGKRLEAVWGPGARSLADLKRHLEHSVAESFKSGDIGIAVQDIRFAHVPSYLGPIVRMIFETAAVSGPKAVEVAVAIVHELLQERLATDYDVNKGLALVIKDLPKFETAVPNAKPMFKDFRKAVQAKLGTPVGESELAAATAASNEV